MKQCRDCKEIKPRDCFYSHKRTLDGLGSYCKVCHKARGDRNRKKNAQPSRSPEAERAKSLKYKYGLTVVQYDALVSSQGGGCGICGTTENLAVDHDHDTGVVRGILCKRCNTGIGMLGDTLERVKRAVDYLERSV